MPIKRSINGQRVPVKIWTDDVDERSLEQLSNVASLPFIHHHVAAMPDVHVGTSEAVNCHHNYVTKEHHYGADVWVIRKGAIRAGKNDLEITPGTLGARSYIVRGKGNPESFNSSAHGAGRRMSRTEANKLFSEDDLKLQTTGVICRKDYGVVDEIPGAYKDIDQVMANQEDLVVILHSLKQLVCVKG